jgi:hypothetical protein
MCRYIQAQRAFTANEDISNRISVEKRRPNSPGCKRDRRRERASQRDHTENHSNLQTSNLSASFICPSNAGRQLLPKPQRYRRL